jgi:predicted peptidase
MPEIKEVICITDNFNNGQRIVGAKVIYDLSIDGTKLTNDTFTVEGRTVVSVSADNNEVTIGLDVNEKAGIILPMPEFGGMGPGGPGGQGKPGGPGGPNGPERKPRAMPETKLKPREVTVTQVGAVYSVDDTVIEGNNTAIKSSSAYEPVIEDFVQSTFNGLPYNLFVPKNLEEGKKYPLVVFIPDGAATGEDVFITLAQGSGAVTWATPQWQEKHPCYVLAPQPNHGFRLTNDIEEAATEKMYVVKGLIDYIAYNNQVDMNRIYCTGQSGGGMCFAEMNIEYPDFFASAMFVACQWNAERFGKACKDKKFWILVSHDDAKAFPGWNAMTEALEANGAKVGRYVWNAKSTPEKLDALAHEASNDGNDIHYTVFEGSSVVPDGYPQNPGTNHHSTWPVAYSITAVKEWLFEQSK